VEEEASGGFGGGHGVKRTTQFTADFVLESEAYVLDFFGQRST